MSSLQSSSSNSLPFGEVGGASSPSNSPSFGGVGAAVRIAIINGPNLNLLGKREPGVYGSQSFDDFYAALQATYPHVEFIYHQSNIEGEIVSFLQQEGFTADGIILNPAAYTHTSVAIGDAIAAITSPVIEVHISNVHAREEFRKISHVSARVAGSITGLGLKGYELALQWFLSKR